MWFGTYDGLNKYDGSSFRVFRNIIGDTTSLLDNHIYSIDSDNENNIWVGGPMGVSIYNAVKSQFTIPFFRKTDNKVLPLREYTFAIKKINDLVLVGTNSSGLIVFSKNSRTGQQISFNGTKRTSYSVSSVEYDPIQNHVWIFINNVGLCRYDLKTKKIIQIAPDSMVCERLFIKRNGEVFIGNNNGVYRLEKNTLKPYESIPRMNVRDIIEDDKSGLWIASDGNGLWHLPPNASRAVRFSTKNGSINSNSIYAIYLDKDKRKWVGTLRGGINIIEEKKSLFKTVSFESSLEKEENNFILSLCEDSQSNLWIGTDGAGLRYWNKSSNSSTTYVHSSKPGSISSNFVTCIIKDSQNELWLSTWFGGINRFNRANNTFKWYNCYNPYKKLVENNVWSMYEDKQKRLWASCSSGGLYTYSRASDRFELFDKSLNVFQILGEDREGKLWGGNSNSLVLIDRLKRKHKTFTIGYSVTSFQDDENNILWIGTEGGGLVKFDKVTQTITRITTNNGLPGNVVLRILKDKKRNLWISTYYGLCRFNPTLNTFRNFTRFDGLLSNQFNYNAALISKSGEFFFGGIKGFISFFPDKIHDRKASPKLFLTGLEIDNVPVEKDDTFVTGRNKDLVTNITLPFDKATLSLDFIALEYSAKNNLQFAYYLKNWDKSWIVNNSRIANYSRLREGNYTFYVKVLNTDGIWSGEQQLLSIKVLPPWYRTWWAYLLYLTSTLALIGLYIHYNKRQERLRYEIHLALIEKEKEKELAERKISFFTHISHEFRTPLTLIISPIMELVAETVSEIHRKKLTIIQRNAKRLLSLVDQLLLFRKVDSIEQQLKMENFDLTETCDEVFLCFTQLASSKNINLQFQKPDKPYIINGDREKIEIILFNLLSNALKYTPSGGQVTLSVTEQTEQLDILVKDTGYGIPENIGNRLFESFYQADNTDKASETGFGIGLYVSQKLAKAHSGNLSFTSIEGQGTAFTLTLPKNNARTDSLSLNQPIEGRQSIVKRFVEDLMEDTEIDEDVNDNHSRVIDRIISGLPSMLIVDDNAELRNYIKQIFIQQFNIYEADNGASAFDLISKVLPDIVVSDVLMKKMNGIELCRKVKESSTLAHIPIILLTASTSEESRLKGIEFGAEDYIKKPFDKELIVAKVQNILKTRNRLQQYFLNTLTLQPTSGIDNDHKDFLERCIKIIEAHQDDTEFTVQTFAQEIGMSHPTLYKKIKSISGLTVNVFIRYLRLRKAADLLINTNKTILEVTYVTGFNDMKYFREQFSKLFGMKPSEFVKRYRKPLGNKIGKTVE